MKRFIKPGLRVFFPLLKGILFDIPKYGGKKKDRYDVTLRHQKMRILLSKINKALDVKYIILGKENILDQSSLYICNHLSASDPLVLYPILDQTPTTFVSKIELKKMKLLDHTVNAIDGLFMDRNDLRQSLKVMKKVEETLRDGSLSWVIFAEGTRTLDSASLMNEMHHGSFRPGCKANVPIIPIAMYGTNILLKEKPLYKYYPVIISILEPIYPNQYEGLKTEQIARIVQERIQKEISFRLRKIHHEEMMKLNNKKYHLHRLVS